MRRSFEDNKTILIQYSVAIGCNVAQTLNILLNVWWLDAQEELIEVCKKKRPSSPEELLKESSIVYLKYKKEIDSVPEMPSDEEMMSEEVPEEWETPLE